MRFFVGLGVVVLFIIVLFIQLFVGIIPNKNPQELFVVQKTDSVLDIQRKLIQKGYLHHTTLFSLAELVQGVGLIQSGGYLLQKNISPWQLASKFRQYPDFAWVTIPPGRRKEEVGEILAGALHWDKKTLQKWNNLAKTPAGDPIEGQLYPDTYLLPISESPEQIANRIIAHFNEVFAPLAPQFQAANIRWTTALKIASLIQREAAGTADMPLIAGILWNRLEKHMPLEIDATIQYARGDTPDGWWIPISASDIQNIDSPYNTYQHSGLPPTPIASPGFDAIKAVLNPADTECLYYLHDHDRQIHCAVTYAEHQANIQQYLQN